MLSQISKIILQIQVPENSSYHQAEAAKKQVDARLEECQRKASAFCNHLATKNNTFGNSDTIKQFNDKLRDRVLHVRGTIEYEKERLQKLHKQRGEELKQTTEKIKSVLKERETEVNAHICREVTAVVREVKKYVQSILEQLTKINSSLQEYARKLQEWIEQSDKLIDDTQGSVKNIIGKTTDNVTGMTYRFEEDAKEVDKRKKDLEGLIRHVKEQLKKKVTEALEAVKAMDGELKQDLFGVREAIKSKVEGIKEKIKKLGENFGSDIATSASGNRGKEIVQIVFEKFRDTFGEIKGTTHKPGLEKVEAGVRGYAWEFKEGDTFTKIVQGWLEDNILGKHKLVEKCLKNYVDGKGAAKPTAYNAASEMYEPIRTAFATTLKADANQIIKKAVDAFTTAKVETEDGDITQNIKKVQNVCKQFAQELDNARANEVGDIVQEIERILTEQNKLNKSPANFYRYHLNDAVEAILVALSTTAREAAKTLEQFALTVRPSGTGSIAAKIDAVNKKADDLFNKLKTALGRPPTGGQTENHAQAVDAAIQQVGTELDAQLPAEKSDKAETHVKLKDVANFNQYNDHVKQENIDSITESNIEQLAGALPNAIKGIGTEAAGIYADHITTGLQTVSSNITQHLEELKEAITQTTNAVQRQLTDLRDTKISMKQVKDDSLQRLQQLFSNVQKELQEGPLKEAKRYLSHVDHSGTATINLLGTHVKKELETAREALTTHATRQYVNALKTLLTEFADKAEKELDKLPQEITDDLDVGYKGFMKKMQEHFMGRVEQIKTINPDEFTTENSPLSQASKTLKGALNLFVIKLQGQENFKADFSQIRPSYTSLTNLLTNLETSKHFDHTFSQNLESLHSALGKFKPSTYGKAKSPLLLNALKKGFSSLASELQNAYVSTYSQKTIKWDDISQPEKEKYAKICLTVTPILHNTLEELKQELENSEKSWKSHVIYNPNNVDSSLHKLFFRDHGYDPNLPDDTAHGELNHKPECNGSRILSHLTKQAPALFAAGEAADASALRTADSPELTVETVTEDGVIQTLYSCLHDYFEVCHHIHIDSPRVPCSIYEMLAWCTGFQFNPVFDKFKKHIESEFTVADKTNPSIKTVVAIEAYPSDVTAPITVKALTDVCEKAYPVLTSILGNGHAGGVYAVEFSNNSLKLYYPSSMVQLLCMLFDVIKRLHEQLHFLYRQCWYRADHSGWRDCHYGKHIAGSSWQCNSLQCANQVGNQMGNQTCTQTCNQHPMCGLKSPLQSFLEDGLVGFLPHTLTSSNGKLNCLVKSHTNVPCRTPMGFADISQIASHIKTGKYLRDTLADFCGDSTACLTQLCCLLNCLLPSAPQTLGQMFGFFYNLFDDWGHSGEELKKHRETAFADAVNDAYFKDTYDLREVANMFGSTQHVNHYSSTQRDSSHDSGDLYSLVSFDEACYTKDHKCGAYMRSVYHDMYGTFASKHKALYLRWVLYLTEAFYQLLKKLLEECEQQCGSGNSKCRVTGCTEKICDVAKASYKGAKQHNGLCQSVVQCPKTLSTLYTSGLTFDYRKYLNGYIGEHYVPKKTCKDLVAQLSKVCHGKSILSKLVNITIPEFLFKIREPFIWTLLGLWAFSLLYLLHIAVVRLDVLRIRSHLKSPSSHRIAAQSLLAAARVKALANVKYFSP
ncbi:hypothetical protein, conserved [Babesia ovata]|uniref:Extracellular matrix-binding ebh n=1 Tax=Babesia ovata TaxID=189622 RepID=A0A2H6KIW1_9APIC|nr:uncharacterized protein BOVATA_044250 [Babesia ovata]GBE62932.1 hypothetical protein, conserved [Babesia ovata]